MVEDVQHDMNRQLMVDGNALAGILQEIFGVEMTSNYTKCGWCGASGEIGRLLAFTHAPGAVLRCPVCENVLMRIVEREDALFLDLRGMAYLRLERQAV